jgi:hypothetical protein
MFHDDDGLPTVGEQSKQLGVRVPPNPHADVDLGTGDAVILNGKGMSVARHWTDLPPHLIPKRLDPQKTMGATGSNQLCCFKMGTGSFKTGAMSESLQIVLKPQNSLAGNIVPAASVTIQQFQQSISATRANWTVDES